MITEDLHRQFALDLRIEPSDNTVKLVYVIWDLGMIALARGSVEKGDDGGVHVLNVQIDACLDDLEGIGHGALY